MNREALVVIALAIGVVWLARRQVVDMLVDDSILDARDALAQGSVDQSGITNYDWGTDMRWNSGLIPVEYVTAIRNAEMQYKLPYDMLARLLYQESHYRSDIISGKTVSTAGALGIAQFMPATAADLGIDPLNPFQAIDAAARYLSNLYRATGTWAQALAAYNWGLGNLRKYGLISAPSETRAYYQSILADIGLPVVMA